MKKIMNHPETLVQEMCHGLVLAHPELLLNPKYKIIYKKELNTQKVSLISGGGSGHEPAHAGFIGRGMLDAAVCGDVFASPSQIQVYQAIKQVATDRGVLMIIKNYSGDMMNFQNAIHLAREDGIPVDYVKVDDDIAVTDSLYTVGRRGVAGTIFVHKLAGAAAEQGKTLAEVKAVAEHAIANVKTIGFALSSCTVPAKGTPTFQLGADEMEYGIGIHGEPGIQRCPTLNAEALAARMVHDLSHALSLEQGDQGNRTAVLVNGFGATPLMELYLLNAAVARNLSAKGITVARTFVGNFMTSLDMAGASISLLKLDETLEALLGEPAEAPALSVSGPVLPVDFYEPYGRQETGGPADMAGAPPEQVVFAPDGLTLENMEYILQVMADTVIQNEIPFCELDAHAGDGDFGMSIAKGFRQLKQEWPGITSAPDLDISGFLQECALVLMEYCGGASGPIWGSAFRAAGRSVKGKGTLTVEDFAQMLEAAVAGIQATGERSFGRGAVEGDKTLIDALAPCSAAWRACAESRAGFAEAFAEGARAAALGAERTKDMVARMGRAGTVGRRSLGHPDAGAQALAVLFAEIAEKINFLGL